MCVLDSLSFPLFEKIKNLFFHFFNLYFFLIFVHYIICALQSKSYQKNNIIYN